MKKRINRVAVISAIFMGCLFCSRTFAADKVVGDTRDACGQNIVQFAGRAGAVTVAKRQSQTVEMPSSTREIYWYCAGTRERSANDTPFNVVQITRDSNRGIHWVFIVRSEPAGGDTIIRVGDTKDACDRSQIVALHETLTGDLNVKAGEIKTADLPSLTRQISWNCGKGCPERSANGLPFNRVQLERAGNGALEWVFYRTLSVGGAGSGSFVHDASGDLMLPALPGIMQPPAGLIKTAIGRFWDQQSSSIARQIQSLFPQGEQTQGQACSAGTLRINAVILSPSSQLELRVQQSADTITLKPVIHGNQIKATIVSTLNVNVTVTFDLEVVLPFPRSQTLTVSTTHQLSGLTLKQPQVLVQHVEIEANDPGSGLLEGLFKANVRAQETQLDSLIPPLSKAVTDAIINAINSQLQPLAKNLSPGNSKVTLDTDKVGDVRLCPAFLGSCQFPAPSAPAPAARVLDTSTDQCSLENIWLWDSELEKFVSIAKGASGRVVQLDDKRFEWYCGDDSEPDPSPSNEESASGPTGTSQVRVARDKDGRAIHWEFLFWR